MKYNSDRRGDNMIDELVRKSRSIRKFDESYSVSYETAVEFIETVRFTPSTVNMQALRYKIITDRNECDFVFGNLGWAGLLKGKGTPAEGERPTAYIFILCDLSTVKELHYDEGIAAQTIMLSAAEKGLGGCIIGSINREKISERYGIDTKRYSIDLVCALGKPKQNTIVNDIHLGDSTAYYRDNEGNHYVPKIVAEDLII